MTDQLESIPFFGEIVLERITRIGHSENPPILELETVLVERDGSRYRVVIRFSDQARFSILSAVEDILSRRDKEDGSPNTPKAVQ